MCSVARQFLFFGERGTKFSPENFEIVIRFSECYFLHFREQLKTYFTKVIKLSLRELPTFYRRKNSNVKHRENIFHSLKRIKFFTCAHVVYT